MLNPNEKPTYNDMTKLEKLIARLIAAGDQEAIDEIAHLRSVILGLRHPEVGDDGTYGRITRELADKVAGEELAGRRFLWVVSGGGSTEHLRKSLAWVCPTHSRTQGLRRNMEAIELYLERAASADCVYHYARAITQDDGLQERLHDLKECCAAIPPDVADLLFCDTFSTSAALLADYRKTVNNILRVLRNA